jgi:branched-chain amino acid transport system substrate-binding protein
MKKMIVLALCMAFVLSIPGLSAAKTLKIGTLSPLTGPYVQDGTDIVQGVKTAVALYKDDVKAAGFEDVEVLPEDSACDGGKATMSANKLINSGVNAVIGAYCSSATIPASIPLNEANILQITPASSNEKITMRGYKQLFRLCPRDDAQAQSTVALLEGPLNAKTIALIDDRQTYTAGLTHNIDEFLKKDGKVEVVAWEHITPGDKDFTAVLTKIKGVNPDVIYMGVYQPEGSLMVRQIKALGITSKLITEDAVYHPKFLEVGGTATEGVYLTFANPPETAERRDFEAKYKAMWNVDKVGSYGYYAFDAAKMLLEAIQKCGSADTDKLAETIRTGQWVGSTGEITFNPNGDRKIAHIIWIVKNGEYVRYWDPITKAYF